ncbi:hypothetical protein B0T24DRAFT_696975 [Lasiosphaeria ovina]|uniref:Uncharacterized protein n=1 Tax=Lasiosphaeria ovina TaxID=92902 RepID=A0AAE0NFF3_9PEZI|nr:hypothetical protein B0T24DRAFT_696975 [Lasiosphaeria ovina]
MSPSPLEATFIKTLHHKPYAAISPLRPELSQAGRTVLVSGGSAGIGFATARAFVQAKAARVIVTGRRPALVAEAAAKLAAEASPATTVSGIATDSSSLADTEALWAQFAADGVVVDVLVLSAAAVGEPTPLLRAPLAGVWAAYETNVRALLDYAQRFAAQAGQGHGKKYLVNISTSAIHNFDTQGEVMPAYGITKSAGTVLLQRAAQDVAAAELQIVSFHPGGVLTQAARDAGYDESSIAWDDENLPGQWAVWAATDEAGFLHGRYVAAWWDVDELKTGEVAKRIAAGEPTFLRVGVVGLAPQ